MRWRLLHTGLFLTLICFGLQQLHGQWVKPPTYGSRKSFNFASMHVHDDTATRALTAFSVGIFGRLPFTNTFALQAELYYIAKGARISYDNEAITGSAEFHFGYVEIPMLITFNISNYFNMQAGPYVSFLINNTVKNISNPIEYDFEQLEGTEHYNRLEAGYILGAGTNIGIFGFGARYANGFTAVTDGFPSPGIDIHVPDATQTAISIYLTLSLIKPKKIDPK